MTNEQREELMRLERKYDVAVDKRKAAEQEEKAAWNALRDAQDKLDDRNRSLRTGSPV